MPNGMTVALLAGGEPHTQRDLKERWKERGLDVRYTWAANATRWPDIVPPTVEVVIQLRDACRHACSNNLDRTIRRMRQRPEGSVTYIVTRRRAPHWAKALDDYGFPVQELRQALPTAETAKIEAAAAASVANALMSSDECDECNGSGRYFIDGEPQACICSEPQTDNQEQTMTPKPAKKRGTPHKPLTADEKQQVKEFLLAGEPVAAIADLFNCSDWPVYLVARENNIKPLQVKKQKALAAKAAGQKAEAAAAAERSVVAAAASIPVSVVAVPREHNIKSRSRRKPMATCTQADLDRAKWLVDGVAMGMIEVV